MTEFIRDMFDILRYSYPEPVFNIPLADGRELRLHGITLEEAHAIYQAFVIYQALQKLQEEKQDANNSDNPSTRR